VERAQNLIGRAYQLIKGRIISLEYAPGQELEVGKLKVEIGISLSPIEMAIQRLNGEGFLKIFPQRGTFVTEISHDEIAALMDYRLVL
jgi:DNA-binding GntR family transcriptional regulator